MLLPFRIVSHYYHDAHTALWVQGLYRRRTCLRLIPSRTIRRWKLTVIMPR